MTNFKAIYGGEFSGHHYFGNFGNMDSGVLAAVLMIKILISEDKKLSQVFEKLKKTYFISDLQAVRLKPGQTFEDVKAKLLAQFNTGTVSEMDGISVFYPDWKFSIRSSQTEPVLRMIVESRITNTVDAKLAEVLAAINA
jgi:phosphomannomutase